VDVNLLERKYELEASEGCHRVVKRSTPRPKRIRNLEVIGKTVPEPEPEPIKIKVGRKKVSGLYARRKRRRLEREASADGKFTPEEWENLKIEYDGRCLRCGTTAEPIVPDHIRSLCKGGSGLIGNIQPLCWRCNLWKGPYRIIDFRCGFHFEII
jgi:hypothetical protein